MAAIDIKTDDLTCIYTEKIHDRIINRFGKGKFIAIIRACTYKVRTGTIKTVAWAINRCNCDYSIPYRLRPGKMGDGIVYLRQAVQRCTERE